MLLKEIKFLKFHVESYVWRSNKQWRQNKLEALINAIKRLLNKHVYSQMLCLF